MQKESQCEFTRNCGSFFTLYLSIFDFYNAIEDKRLETEEQKIPV